MSSVDHDCAPVFEETSTEKKFEKLVEDIEKIYKHGTYNTCPSCNKETKVYVNPMYMHKCEHCGWTGDLRNCKTVFPKDDAKKMLMTKFERFLR